MIAQLEALRDLIEDAVAEASCAVTRVAITAGRAAAPSGDDCTTVYVYTDNMADDNQDNPLACMVVSRHAMLFEVWSCYEESWDDVAVETHELTAACFYELMSLIWCALVEAKDIGYFCDNCSAVELVPFQVQARSGGMVSAIGGVTLPYACPVPTVEESPSSP